MAWRSLGFQSCTILHTAKIAKSTGTRRGPPETCRPMWAPPRSHEPCCMCHYTDFIMTAMASQITSLTIVYSTVYIFRHRPKKTLKFRATGLCAGNSPVTGEFPTQRDSNAETVSIWWRHHGVFAQLTLTTCFVRKCSWLASILSGGVASHNRRSVWIRICSMASAPLAIAAAWSAILLHCENSYKCKRLLTPFESHNHCN